MSKFVRLSWVVLVVIANSSNSVAASQPNNIGADSGVQSMYNTRMQEMLDTTGWNFGKALNTKQIFKEWQSNQARAQLKFSAPGTYHGRIDKVVVDNGNANFILDYGKSTAVTVILASYQASSWKIAGTQLKVGELQSNLEFAANIESGQEMYFQCRRVEFGLGVFLNNCLAFAPNIALAKARPEIVSDFDVVAHFDELIKARASEGWARPRSVRENMKVTLQISMVPDGTITSVSVVKSSGDASYDSSVRAAIKNIGRLAEVQGMRSSDFARYREFNMTFAREDLAL